MASHVDEHGRGIRTARYGKSSFNTGDTFQPRGHSKYSYHYGCRDDMESSPDSLQPSSANPPIPGGPQLRSKDQLHGARSSPSMPGQSLFPPQKPLLPEHIGQAESTRLHSDNQNRRVEELERKLARYTPVSVAHFDQAMADLVRTLKPVDHRDEVVALRRDNSELKIEVVGSRILREDNDFLRHRVGDLIRERDEACSEGRAALERETESAVAGKKKCDETKEELNKTMKAKVAIAVAAGEKKYEQMKKDRDRWSKRADNLLNKLAQVEGNYDALQQRDESLKDSLRTQINTLQTKLKTQEDIIREQVAPVPSTVRTSTRLGDLAKEQDRKNKRKINQLTQERDEALAIAASLSRQEDGSRKRPRVRE